MEVTQIQIDVAGGQETVEFHPLPEHGCYVGLLDGTLLELPMLADGTCEQDDPTEVAAPESEEFLIDVNALLGTHFTLNRFAGR